MTDTEYTSTSCDKQMPHDDPCDDWSDHPIPKSGADSPKCTDECRTRRQ